VDGGTMGEVVRAGMQTGSGVIGDRWGVLGG
jgi:hypothetical protein